MEYPILPGSVLPQDVEYAGQRVAARQMAQRPNAVERQVQYVNSVPAQHPTVYQQAPTVVHTTVPAYQHVLVRPVVQAAAAPPPATYQPSIPSTRVKSDRCCTTRATIITSVLIICVLIGAAVGAALYFKYGRDNDNDNNGNGNNGIGVTNGNTNDDDDDHHHNCVTVDGGNNNSKPEHHSNDDDDKDDDKDDDDDDDDRRKPGGHHFSDIPGCFHQSNDGTYILQGDINVIYYDSDGSQHSLGTDGLGYWVLGDDGTLTHQGTGGGLPNGVSICKD